MHAKLPLPRCVTQRARVPSCGAISIHRWPKAKQPPGAAARLCRLLTTRLALARPRGWTRTALQRTPRHQCRCGACPAAPCRPWSIHRACSVHSLPGHSLSTATSSESCPALWMDACMAARGCTADAPSGPLPATAPHRTARSQALLAAGARMRGKTHMDELAYSLNGENVHYGTPTNPAAPGRIPGGSSSGSAVRHPPGLPWHDCLGMLAACSAQHDEATFDASKWRQHHRCGYAALAAPGACLSGLLLACHACCNHSHDGSAHSCGSFLGACVGSCRVW